MKNITTTQIKNLDSKDFVLLNVLPAEYFDVVHIPNSKNACIYKTAFKDDVKKIIKDKKTNIVVYGLDDKHEAVDEAAKSLKLVGYKNVLIYKEGIEGWEKSGGKLIGSKKYPKTILEKKNYKVDLKNSYFEWEGSNIGNKHHGKIAIKTGNINTTKNKIIGGEIVLDMNKITCDDLLDKVTNGYLIAHLKSSDFFEVNKYKTAKIKIKKVTKISDIDSSLNYSIDSLITIKDITHPVKFDIHGHVDNGKLIAQGNLVLDRSKWNVKYGSSRFFEWLGMHLVNDQIRLRFKIVAS